jgi:hypothetical protein
MKSQLDAWKSRNISLLGKIHIVKTLAISQILYVTNMLDIPPQFITDANAIIFSYIWKGTDKVKRWHIVGNYHEVCLKMVDLESKIQTQRVMWVKRLMEGLAMPWTNIPNLLLNEIGGVDVIKGCPDSDIVKQSNLTPFYKECLLAWNKWRDSNIEEAPADILGQFIYNNKNVQKCLLQERLNAKGIKFLYNLYDLNLGRMYTWNEIINRCPPNGLH